MWPLFNGKRRGVFHHITLEVENLKEAIEELKEKGIKLLSKSRWKVLVEL